MSKDKDDNNKISQLESSDEPFSLILGEPAKGPEDSDIGTIFVNDKYRIRRFVSTVTDLINVESFNMNHALEDFTRRLAYEKFKDDIDNVRENNIWLKKKVREKSGRWYIMELRPHTTKEKVKGVVITFVDITELQNTKEELAKRIEENKELQREIISNDVAQRWDIGRYLHDEIAQSLLAAEMLANSIKEKLGKRENNLEEEMEDLISIIKRNVTGVRDLSHDVSPVDLEGEMGMLDAFSNLAKQLEKIHGIKCELKYDDIMDTLDNKEIATHLYHTAHEGAKNAAIHGKAGNVRITLKSDGEYLYLTIEDDGSGLPNSSKEKNEGMGTNIMRHRMELVGGTLKIQDTSILGDSGTTVACMIPIEKL